MKKIRKTITIIVAVVSVAIIGIVARYFGAINNFLDKITNPGPEMKSYNVIVLEDSEIKELASLDGQSVGFLATDPKAMNAAEVLKTKLTYEMGLYDDLGVLTGALNNKITPAIVLEGDRVDALKEEENDPLKNSIVIYTFEVEVESEDIEISAKEVTGEPFIIYISGSDSRHGIKATARSDVNILAVVNPQKGQILLVSIPRDTYVQLHDTYGLKDKLTHAGIYGINMSKTTIEDFLGINIDHTIKVSFETVVRVVDQLDGIEINSDTEMKLKPEGQDKVCHYVVGVQKVDGDCALRFARERKTYLTGDRHRGENQQQVIASIIAKLSSSRNYVLKIPTILDIAADSFETSLSRNDITKFIRMQLEKQIDWQVKSISVDGAGAMEPTYSMGANLPLYVMIPDAASVSTAQQEINNYLSLAPETDSDFVEE